MEMCKTCMHSYDCWVKRVIDRERTHYYGSDAYADEVVDSALYGKCKMYSRKEENLRR